MEIKRLLQEMGNRQSVVGNEMELKELLGKVLDEKYQINKQLGEGGMGSVFFATHLGTGRPVALKVITPKLMANEEFVERFRREAKAAGLLRHPNIVDVTDFGFSQVKGHRIAYLVMEYLEGVSLSDVLSEEKELPLSWVIDIFEQVCSAVERAHREGVVHRDLKPDNIWLEPNDRGGFTVKVLDFGLAYMNPLEPAGDDGHALAVTTLASGTFPQDSKETLAERTENLTALSSVYSMATVIEQGSPTEEDSGALTRAGAVMGTPSYMSPEQCMGRPVGKKSDIYSLGVIVYEMIAGQRPFTGNVYELLKQHKEQKPPSLKAIRPQTPKRVADLVMSALAKNPQDRPASADAFAKMLRTNAEGSSVLLRRAITLYSEYFPQFFTVSLLSNLPAIGVEILDVLNSSLMASQVLPENIGTTAAWVLKTLKLLFSIVAGSVLIAITVRMVAQYLLVPLRPLGVRQAFEALRKRLRSFLVTAAIVNGLVIAGFAFAVIPGLIVMTLYALAIPVMMMEKLSGWKAMQRARHLAKRSRRSVFLVVLVQFAIPFVISFIAGIEMTYISKYSNLNVELLKALSESATILLNILALPMVAIMMALLYVKSRQAGGESVKATLAEFEEEEQLHSNWQSRLYHSLKTSSRTDSNKTGA
jgi:serine/threonine protein kinase